MRRPRSDHPNGADTQGSSSDSRDHRFGNRFSAVTGARMWRRNEPEERWIRIALAPLGAALWAGARCWHAGKALRR
jgi:hypothetical protein